MPNMSHQVVWPGLHQNSSLFGSDLHWSLHHIRSKVNCTETTSGVLFGCVYHTLEVGQSSCLCLFVTPQAIKLMFYCSRALFTHSVMVLEIENSRHRKKEFLHLWSELRNMASQLHSVIIA